MIVRYRNMQKEALCSHDALVPIVCLADRASAYEYIHRTALGNDRYRRNSRAGCPIVCRKSRASFRFHAHPRFLVFRLVDYINRVGSFLMAPHGFRLCDNSEFGTQGGRVGVKYCKVELCGSKSVLSKRRNGDT